MLLCNPRQIFAFTLSRRTRASGIAGSPPGATDGVVDDFSLVPPTEVRTGTKSTVPGNTLCCYTIPIPLKRGC